MRRLFTFLTLVAGSALLAPGSQSALAARADRPAATGSLSHMVLQMHDLPAALRSGTHHIASIPLSSATLASAHLSGSSAHKYGLIDGYSTLFYHQGSSQIMVSSLVMRYASASGAHQELSDGIAKYPSELPKAARKFLHIAPIHGVGDEAFAITLASKPTLTDVLFRQGNYVAGVMIVGGLRVGLQTVEGLASAVERHINSHS